MKTLVLGSLNIDCTYRVNRFVQAKETISAVSFKKFCGGKGFNQAVALARASAEVCFAGVIGPDGDMLRQALMKESICADYLKISDQPTGHAIIQVNDHGENCIIVVAGANGEVSQEYINRVLDDFHAGDLLVMQNEVPNVDYAVKQARKKGMIIALNPSPFNERMCSCPLDAVDYLLINEVEGNGLTGETDPVDILRNLKNRYPKTAVVLTLGEKGSCFMSKDGTVTKCNAVRCEAIDTTAAGDTFTGYFLTEYLRTLNADAALLRASAASAIAVSRIGAAASIPFSTEVEEMLAITD